jgi:hypothetical protein
VGQDEDPQPFMRRADFSRREQARRRRVAQSPKLSQDGFEAEGDVPGDIFEENPAGLDFPDDAGNIGPQVTLVIGPTAQSGCAERLARVSGKDCIKSASERPSVKAAQIVPDRGWGKVSGPLGGDEDGAGPLFPFDEAAGVESRLGEHEAHIQASAACAERQSVPGT